VVFYFVVKLNFFTELLHRAFLISMDGGLRKFTRAIKGQTAKHEHKQSFTYCFNGLNRGFRGYSE
jgi:hypothetical protein